MQNVAKEFQEAVYPKQGRVFRGSLLASKVERL